MCEDTLRNGDEQFRTKFQDICVLVIFEGATKWMDMLQHFGVVKRDLPWTGRDSVLRCIQLRDPHNLRMLLIDLIDVRTVTMIASSRWITGVVPRGARASVLLPTFLVSFRFRLLRVAVIEEIVEEVLFVQRERIFFELWCGL